MLSGSARPHDLKHLLPFLGSSLFLSVNVKGMMTGNESVQLAGCIDDFLHAGIAEFNHGAVFNINQMIMLNALISFLKLGYVFTKLVLYNQVTIKEQFNGVIQRSPAYPVIFV